MSSVVRAVLTLLCVLAITPAAAAHIVVLPEESDAGGWERYTLIVPTEKKSPTVRIELKLPAGIEVMGIESKPGWEAMHEPFPLGAARVRWTGGRIPSGQLLTFDLLVWNPKAARTLTWDATQWYEDGTSDRWGEPGNPDRPASQTILRESSGGREHHHHPGGATGAVANGAVPSAPPASPAPGTVAAGGHDDAPARDTDASHGAMDARDPGIAPDRPGAPAATVLAVMALVVSAAALAIALRNARRTRDQPQ
jgi:uncharacterized protein YcnI